VTEISPVAREPSQRSPRRSFQVTIALSEENHDQLLPGLSVKAEILGRDIHDAILAPRVALDFNARPVRLRAAFGRDIGVDVGLCDAQRCEVQAHESEDRSALSPGLRLRAGRVDE
jgi:multidrug efflux pump subunit AcrA (membrane-fusion protein)